MSQNNITPPDLNIPEKNMTPDWYRDCIRSFSLAYNRKLNILNEEENSALVNRVIEYYKYYLGRQSNVNYNHVTQDETGNTLQGVFIKGQKISQLIDYMNGVFQGSVRNLEVDAECVSKDAYDAKADKLNTALFEFDIKPLLESMAKLGVTMTPSMSEEFDTKEDIYKHFEIDFKEQGELDCIDTANDIMFRNRFAELFPKVGMTCFITGICAVHPYVMNGKTYQELIPTYNLIWDNSKDDDYNRKAQFGGFKNRLPVSEVIQKYYSDLSKIPGAIADLKKIATSGFTNDFLLEYNTNPQFNWWANNNSVPEVTCVTMYWVSSKDLKYEESTDAYGNQYYSKIKKEAKVGKIYTNTVRKGVLIGNKYLVDFGEATNIVRDWFNPSDTLLPIRIFTPNMFLGSNRSVVSRLAQNQDKLDRISYHIDTMIGRDLGKVYVINGNKVGTDSKSILQDLKTMGFTISKGVSGEDDDRTENQRMVETIDMTTDPNINLYVQLKRDEERIMEEIVNISKIALGQQTTYVGFGTQRNSIAQSALGQSYLYDGLMQFLTETLQYSVDQQVIVWGMPEFKDKSIPVLGKRGAKWLDITEHKPFEKYLIKIKTQDQMSDAAKQRLMTNAQALAQNGLIDFLDLIKLETSTSLIQLQNDVEYSLKKKERKQNEAQQQQAIANKEAQNKEIMAQLALQEQANAGKMQVEKQAGKNSVIKQFATNASQGQMPPME